MQNPIYKIPLFSITSTNRITLQANPKDKNKKKYYNFYLELIDQNYNSRANFETSLSKIILDTSSNYIIYNFFLEIPNRPNSLMSKALDSSTDKSRRFDDITEIMQTPVNNNDNVTNIYIIF